MEVSIWYLHTMWRMTPQGAANFIEPAFKQASSLSLESLMHFLNAHQSVSIIISFTICIYNILRKPSPKPENIEWQGMWRHLGET